jgi:hypothetical protein
MNSAASLLDPASNPTTYVVSVLALYSDMPDTPLRSTPQDQRQARSWFDGGIPLMVVEAALLLGSLRRIRPPGVASLPRVRSLAYFHPVVEELLENPVPDAYVQYLRSRLRSIFDKVRPTDVQKSTFSDDR